MVLLYAPSAVPTTGPRVKKWTSCQHTWVGWDGSEWDLSAGLSGLTLLAGTRGMQNPPTLRYSTKAAVVAGSFYRGSITDERDVFWNLKVFSDSGTEAWLEHNRRFWRTMNAARTGTWSVVQPSGVRRRLTVRYTGIADDSDDFDPGLRGWAHYGIQMVAEQPFWQGEVVRREFRAAGTGANYYGGGGPGGFGPPYVTQPGSTTSNATITNEGEEEAWPVWKITGPTDFVSVGIDGHLVTVPFVIGEGNTLTIDASPTRQDAIDQDGTDRTSQLGEDDFAAIPPGEEVPLDITISGAGVVAVELEPLYNRAAS